MAEFRISPLFQYFMYILALLKTDFIIQYF